MSVHDSDLYIRKAQFVIWLCVQTAIAAGFIVSDHVRVNYHEKVLEGFEREVSKFRDESRIDRADLRVQLAGIHELSYKFEQCQQNVQGIAKTLDDLKREPRNHVGKSHN